MNTRHVVVAAMIAAFSIPAMAGTCSPADKKEAIHVVLDVAGNSLNKQIKQNPKAKEQLPALQKVVRYVKANRNTISCQDAMKQKAKVSSIIDKYSDGEESGN